MIHSFKAYWKKSPRSRMFVLGGAGIVVLAMAGMGTGGMVWHQKPSFCATCHTPMGNFVKGYKSGDKTLMITAHATGKSAKGTRTTNAVKTTQVCLDCHKPTITDQVTQGAHWLTGNYEFPLKQELLGTRNFCLSPGCHIEAEVIKATKDYGGAVPYNQHDPRHGKLECYRCHSMHGQSVLMCNQCHNLKLPDGWISPPTMGD
jgi:hypothetical protein